MLKREKELMFFGLNPDQKSYEGLKLFVIIYIGVALFAGALSSPIYWLVQWIDAANSTETTRWLLGKRLDVYFNRISYAGIIIMLPYMMKRCGLFSVRNLGLGFSRLAASRFAKFFALGVALSASIFACQYAFCDVAKSPEFTAGALPKILGEAVLGGVLLALLEEVVFRALIMRCFYTAWGPVWAIVCGALFFSYKHFGTPNSLWDELAKNMTPTRDAGFIVAWYDTVGI
ncbi:MAG: hypothetical protein IJI37_00335, partial [Opitutales bacterium]|nr:hypothetical protein [Opitutales bacterium]